MKKYKENDTVILVDQQTGKETIAKISRCCSSFKRKISDYEVFLEPQRPLFFSALTGKQKYSKKGTKVFYIK